MIEPALSDDAFLADVRTTADADSAGFRLWWLGQSGYLLQYRRSHLLIDPYLSDSLTAKYAQTEKPHVRMTRRVIDPARLNFIDAVICSHQHTDHLDPPTLQALVAANPGLRLIAPTAHAKLALKRSGARRSRLSHMNNGDMLKVNFAVGFSADILFKAIASAHDKLEQDEAGNDKYLGYVIRFDGHTIYHSGDTVAYPGLAEILAPEKVDVAILPINGKVGNMDGKEAAALAHAMGATIVIPCHYDMFTFNTADPANIFIPQCRRLGQRFAILRAGERWDSERDGGT